MNIVDIIYEAYLTNHDKEFYKSAELIKLEDDFINSLSESQRFLLSRLEKMGEDDYKKIIKYVVDFYKSLLGN